MSLNIRQHLLPYTQRLESRWGEQINLLVIHCTELEDLAMARRWGEKIVYPESQTGNSGHFYVNRDGSIEQWVPITRIAHHVRGHNRSSIGIELVNTGRYPHWYHSSHQQMSEHYNSRQIGSLVDLVNDLTTKLPGLKSVAGHADIDTTRLPSEDKPDVMIQRKLDPGPQFPWSSFLDRINLDHLFVPE